MNSSHLLALVAGFFLPVQIALNNRLTLYTGSPLISSLCSFAVGTVALMFYNMKSVASLQKASQSIGDAPIYLWFGGLVGCFYIVTSLIVMPRIGLAVALGLIIGGQLCMSLLFDHFGWLGVEVKPFTWFKALGLLLVIVGVLFIKK